MDEAAIHVRTPEQVDLEFTLAGIGSRAIAQLIDGLILAVFNIILILGALLWLRYRLFGAMTSYVLGGSILFSFFALWGYFIAFEYFMSGQTLGKKIVKIRVVSSNGQPVSFLAVVIRNFLRIVDLLPTGYLVGVISMVADKQERRIGDLAAGTIVVIDRPLWRLGLAPDVVDGSARSNQSADGAEPSVQVTFASADGRIEVVIRDEPPEQWQAFFREFHRRRKGMSKEAIERLAEKAWQDLTLLPWVEVHYREADVGALPARAIVEMVAGIAKNFKARRKGVRR